MNQQCTRWARLVDDEAIGETLAKDDRAFVRSHAATCESCGAESAMWESLGSMVDGPAAQVSEAPPPPPSPGPNPAPEELPAPPAPVLPAVASARSRRNLGLAVAGLSVAASIAFLVAFGGRKAPPSAPVTVAQQPTVVVPPPSTQVTVAPVVAASEERALSLSLTSGGAVEIDGREGKLGAKIAKGSILFARSGEACIVVDPTVRACLERGSMVRVAETGAHRRLELLRGRIVAELDPQPAGTSFGVTTRDGSAVAIGTAFAVEVPEGTAPVVTRVLHGVVLVRSELGKEQRVGAHQGTTMRSDAPHTSTNAEEERDRTLAAPLPSLTESTSAEPVSFVSAAPGAKAIVDDRVVGVTPLAILLPPGDHAVVVRSEGAENRTTVHVEPSAGVSAPLRTVAVVPTPEPRATVAIPPSTPPASVATSTSTMPPLVAPTAAPEPLRAAELLANARERRGRGDTSGAVSAYQELFGRYPNAPESHAALVPYGEIQLAKLSDPNGALGSFERYLVRGGPLAEEATFGKIRALRALGRTDDERATIASFLSTHPESTLAPALRARAEGLSHR